MVTVLLTLFFITGITSRGLEFSHFYHARSASASVLKFRSIFSFLDMFSIGMAIAYLERQGALKRLIQQVPAFVPLLMGGFLLAIANIWCTLLSPGEWMTSNNLAYTLFFSPLICAGFGLFLLTNIFYKETRRSIFNTYPLASIGLISYSVYLYHIGVQFVVFSRLHLDRYIANWSLVAFLNGLISLPFVLLVSYMMYFLVEKPSLRWLNRRRVAMVPQ